MNQLNEYIKQIEDKWLSLLFNHSKSLFNKVNIPSHDHTHHLRVWEYSKELLNAMNDSYEITEVFVEACLIASLFHDTGLTININENHGQESRKICEQFFKENAQKPKYLNEILSAIEFHDDKDYKINNTTDPYSIYSILCSADDLDAFGNIGVIRYTEIYLLRGINIQELPQLVIQNLDKRFLFFEKVYGGFPNLYQSQKARYLTTRNFFEDLLKEI